MTRVSGSWAEAAWAMRSCVRSVTFACRSFALPSDARRRLAHVVPSQWVDQENVQTPCAHCVPWARRMEARDDSTEMTTAIEAGRCVSELSDNRHSGWR